MSNLQESNPRDVELGNSVSRAIHGMASGIHVSVKAGHVTVSGVVDDFSEKRDLTSAVQSVAGVKTITNNVRVSPTWD
jgi:osmotically-inducible protein OsmY